MPLGRTGDTEPPLDVELAAAVHKAALLRVREKPAVAHIGHDGTFVPRVPQLACCLEELAGTLVALPSCQVAATAEVLAGERVPRRHHVPGGAPFGEVVE